MKAIFVPFFVLLIFLVLTQDKNHIRSKCYLGAAIICLIAGILACASLAIKGFRGEDILNDIKSLIGSIVFLIAGVIGIIVFFPKK